MDLQHIPIDAVQHVYAAGIAPPANHTAAEMPLWVQSGAKDRARVYRCIVIHNDVAPLGVNLDFDYITAIFNMKHIGVRFNRQRICMAA